MSMRSPTKFYHVTKIILLMYLCDHSLVTIALYERSYHNLNFIRTLLEKPLFLSSLQKFINMGLALGMNLKFYIRVAKELKIKFRMFWRLIPTFVEVTGEKLVGDGCDYFPYSMRNELIKCCFFL